MKKYKQNTQLSFITYFVALILINATFSNLHSQTINILPLGNSITQSFDTRYSYRYYLWKKLLDENIDFDYLGLNKDNLYGNPEWPQ